MASESTSSQQSSQLIPSSKVNFGCLDSIIGFNNVLALLEHSYESFQPMLSFLSNCCINKALTLQPTTMYMEYLKEFWYIAEVEEETKTITFLLSWWDEPLSFTQDEFISAIGLPICTEAVPLPPKETVRAGLATLVAKLSEQPEQPLIPPSEEVNADDFTDKSSSRTSMHLVTQPKATTGRMTKKRRIPPSSKPKSPRKVGVILLKKQFAETQHAEFTVATADASKSLDSKSAEEQGNQPSTAEAEKVLDQNVEEERDAEFVSMEEVAEEPSKEIPIVEQLLDKVDKQNKVVLENSKSPYDTESAIKVVKSYFTSHIPHEQDQILHDSDKSANVQEDSDYESMPEDNLRSVSRFARLEMKLSKTLKSDMGKSVTSLVKSGMKEKTKKANDVNTAATQEEHQSAETLVESQGEQPANVKVANKESTPPAPDNKPSEGKELVVYNSEKKKSEGIISVEDDSDEDNKQPLSKRFKILTPIPDIPNPTLLNTFVLEHLLKSKEQQKSMQEFTDQLFKTTSSRFSPTPPREPTPPRDSSKGKAVAIIEEPGNELVQYQEEGGFNPKAPKLKPFITPEGPLSKEKYDKQIKELKRISDLKAEKEKSEQELRKLLNPVTLKAYAQKWTEHEPKKAKMMEEYNHQISYIADPLPITKISYVVNSRKEATMKITRGDNPLNLIVHPNFRLKTLESKFIKEVFITRDVRVDGMDRNLIPPPGVLPIQGLVINKPENKSKVDSEIAKEMLSRMNYVIEAKSDCTKAMEIVMKGLSECKASESNVRRIQVKDIIKEVKDHLKTYSSAGMDISWYVEGIR
ncbi:hypothetical protein Tco_0322981 [Tanacetum coccineum]